MKVNLTPFFLVLISQISLGTQFMESPKVRKLSEFAIDPIKLFNESLAIKDEGNKKFDDSKTQKDIIDKMGFGWNLGNTLDAVNFDDPYSNDLGSEYRWGQPKTTEEIIQKYKNKGLKSFRIPVTWKNHLIDEKYTIDPKWMARVKEIVDWGLKNDFVVILNTHHDGNKARDQPVKYGHGYYPANLDRAESERFIFNIWSQIGTAFNNGYDQNLIFECMNEPRPEDTECQWTYQKGDKICDEATSSLNEYNKICLKAIRDTGGNNEKRFVLVSATGAQYQTAVYSDFIFPGDKKYNPTNNKIMLSVHMYYPFNFAFLADKQYSVFTDRMKNEFYPILRNLYEKFVLRGHNVIIGEMGCADKDNAAERVKWANFYIQTTRKFQMSCLIWEIYPYGIYDRPALKWTDEAVIKALVDSSNIPLPDNPEEEYEPNLISSPVTFINWKIKIYLDPVMFSGYNSFCKLVFTKIDTNPVTELPALKISHADWTSSVTFNQSDVEGAEAYSDGGMGIVKGTQNVKIFLNNSMCKLLQSKGLVFDGNGFIINDVHISGPRFVKMEPKTIKRSPQKQTLKLYFNEDATAISNKIKFINFFYNLNNQVQCLVDKSNNKTINCKGIFNFTGEYFLEDINHYSLTNRFLNVVPKKGEKYNNK
jgi:endoglucanase